MGRHRLFSARGGFTLLELVIVLFVIGLILGLSSVFFAGTLSSARFDTTIREMATGLRQARSLSYRTNEKQVLTIDLDAKQYGLGGRDTKPIPPEINIKIIDPFAGEVITGQYPFTFSMAGGIQGGTIVLWNNKRSAQIQMDPVVGSVVIK